MTFVYAPIDLEGPAFRLVRVSGGNTSSDIECELFQANFDGGMDAMPYHALSYTWGGEDKPASIVVNGSEMPVTRNLHDALWHLRYAYEDRILWIDAICIDQSNNDERMHQVQNMGNIYKAADQVIVWLGLGNPGTDLVMEHMRQQDKLVVHSSSGWQYFDEQVPYTEELGKQLKDELGKLLGRSWFKRVWVLQEIANARRASIVCGSKVVSARTFAVIPSLLYVEASPQCNAVLDIMPGGSRQNSWWSRDRRLYTILERFNRGEASDERDMIYAMLNLSSDASDSQVLRPNYQKQLTELIRETTSFLLFSGNGTASGLGYVQWTLSQFWQNLGILSNVVLVEAAKENDVEVMKLLLGRDDCDVNWEDADARTSLSWAAHCGSEAAVKLLLNTFGIITTLSSGETALSRAAENGHEAVVELLLKTQYIKLGMADITLYGDFALRQAVANGHAAIAKQLLDMGVKPILKQLEWRDTLSKARRLGHVAALDLLQEVGLREADPSHITERCLQPRIDPEAICASQQRSVERPQAWQITAEELRDLSDMIRERYTLDRQIFSERFFTPADKDRIMAKMGKADALLLAIRHTAHQWNRSEYFEPGTGQFEKFQEIVARIDKPGKREWLEKIYGT